jgi:hypothetical protein
MGKSLSVGIADFKATGNPLNSPGRWEASFGHPERLSRRPKPTPARLDNEVTNSLVSKRRASCQVPYLNSLLRVTPLYIEHPRTLERSPGDGLRFLQPAIDQGPPASLGFAGVPLRQGHSIEDIYLGPGTLHPTAGFADTPHSPYASRGPRKRSPGPHTRRGFFSSRALQ